MENDTHLLIRGMSPGEDIVAFAKEQEVDSIIIGVKRRSKVGKVPVRFKRPVHHSQRQLPGNHRQVKL